jgi:catechol 2,3-dioxygenase-like lactoylglutathione lyase family enzyme
MKVALALVLAGLTAAPAAAQAPAPAVPPAAAAAAPTLTTVAPVLWQPSMNVFRRFAVEREKMIAFYGQVLGLKPLPTFNLGGGSQMTRFQVGTSEVKLTGVVRNRTYGTGAIDAIAGLRLLTFFFPDEAALSARFTGNGLPAPAFHDAGPGRRSALVQDPDGQWVEMVVIANAPPDTFDRIEVGITATDLEKSRAFYREFVGLQELPPVQDTILKVTKYPFRHGTTTINVWSFGGTLPVNTGSAGIQYVVNHVDPIDTLAKARGVKIDTPLSSSMGTLRTIWLGDPDGVTNYFAETAQSRAARK